MNSFTLLLVCVQALLVQNVLSCPNAASGLYGRGGCGSGLYGLGGCGSGLYRHGAYAAGPYVGGAFTTAALPCGGTHASYIAPACEPYGLRAQSNNLVIDGIAQVWGDMPFTSSVSLNGEVPSEGIASLRDACCCGDAYLH